MPSSPEWRGGVSKMANTDGETTMTYNQGMVIIFLLYFIALAQCAYHH